MNTITISTILVNICIGCFACVGLTTDMDTRSRNELTNTMKEITELENPNSVQQMKAWLSDNGLKTDTL